MSSAKVAILIPDAPAPNSLMSQSIICNGMIYCSGSLGLDPKTGTFVPGDASDRTVQALQNLEAILKAAGSDLNKAVKINIFVSSMDHYAKVNEGYAKVFTDDIKIKPCRTCVAVAKLPLDAEVEIDLFAAA